MRRIGAISSLLGLFSAFGCPLLPPLTETGSEASGSVASSSGGTGDGMSSTSASPTTGVGLPGSTGGGTSTSTSSSTGSPGDGTTFIVRVDGGSFGGEECDPFAQNCPPGEKCTWYAYGGGSSWDSTKCVPVMEDPAAVGEACFVVGNGVSGIDNCEAGSFCWDTNAENIGYCIAFCTGSLEAPMCPPGFTCAGGRSLSICMKGCDPLLQDCPMGDDVCIGSGWGDGFLCVLDASGDEGQVHDPCEYSNSCDPGLICLNSTAAVECDPNAGGCCEPFCDVTKPNTCPGQGQVCNPYYEAGMAPEGEENIGYCAVPR